jgi:hypothetical protein
MAKRKRKKPQQRAGTAPNPHRQPGDAAGASVFPLHAALVRRQREINLAFRRDWVSPLSLLRMVQELNLEAFELAQRLHDAGSDQDFMSAFMGLMKRTITNVEVVIQCAGVGNYGSAFALLRTLMTDLDTLRYIASSDTLPTKWKELASHYRPGTAAKDKSQTWRELEGIFRDSEIRKELQARGEQVSGEGYGMFIEASHSSAWGLRFYSKPAYDTPGTFTLHSALAEYDHMWSLTIVGMLIGFGLMLVPVLLDRITTKRIEAPAAARLRTGTEAVRHLLGGYQKELIEPNLDLLSKIWAGEMTLPDGAATGARESTTGPVSRPPR